ncbi:MAG: hypothetical protein QOK25_59 [Thermoleophilaceae bacterium]|jgi:hypothetical protein|nr:hypothetical protein [Thermoleophilaceae bacterium]
MKSQAERNQERRDAKLEEIARDVEKGSLVIRKMTKAEREKFPPREQAPGSAKRRR